MMRLVCNLVGSGDLYKSIFGAIAAPMEGKSLIDLCCCQGTITKTLPFKEKTFVDVQRYNDMDGLDFAQTDVLGDHPVFKRQYDVALCSDGIEHLNIEDGYRLVDRMMRISDTQVLFTPLDPWRMVEGGQHPDDHKSLWKPEDFYGFASVVCPNWHPTISIGAFFVWRCPDMIKDFLRVRAELIELGII